MYRDSTWEEGFFIDNHDKYVCRDCGKQFIIGRNMSEGCPAGFPVCPYCGQPNIECTVWTEDNELEALESDMGCLVLHVEEN